MNAYTRAILTVAAMATVLASPDALADRRARGKEAGGVAGVPAPCGCAADLDGSGEVDGADLGLLLGGWGTAAGDLDGTGETDGADLGLLLGAWGPCLASVDNDFCQNATEITGEPVIPFCTVSATTSGPAFPAGPCVVAGYNDVDADLWYRYTAQQAGMLTVSTCGANFDTRLVAYGGFLFNPITSCPSNEPFGQVIKACNDDHAPCGLDSQITFEVFQGSNYLIRVGGYEGASGAGELAFDLDQAGHSCDDPIELGQADEFPVIVDGDSSQYDVGSDESPCGTGDTVAVWYRVILACNVLDAPGNVVVTTCDEFTDFDTVISVWKSSGGDCPGVFHSCNDDFDAPECQIGPLNRKSQVVVPSINGDVLYIRVSGYLGATGNFRLKVITECG